LNQIEMPYAGVLAARLYKDAHPQLKKWWPLAINVLYFTWLT
jgi:hypothetical protein